MKNASPPCAESEKRTSGCLMAAAGFWLMLSGSPCRRLKGDTAQRSGPVLPPLAGEVPRRGGRVEGKCAHSPLRVRAAHPPPLTGETSDGGRTCCSFAQRLGPVLHPLAGEVPRRGGRVEGKRAFTPPGSRCSPTSPDRGGRRAGTHLYTLTQGTVTKDNKRLFKFISAPRWGL